MRSVLNIEVREETPADADEVAAVAASAIATLRETYRPTQKAISHKQAIASSLTRLVAVHNGRVIGAVQYSLIDDRLHFLSLGVLSNFRRRGVTRQLIDALNTIAQRAGAARLSAYTVAQTGNCEIFERLGFRVISEEPTDYYESDRFDTLTEAYLERLIV
jgi:ribosomal protein S18 acetylase RimI-like enzyme